MNLLGTKQICILRIVFFTLSQDSREVPSSILRFLPIVISRTNEILQSVMKKKIIYFISFILVSCISGYFLCKHDNYVYTLLYILSIMLASYLLYKAFPINYKKEENDNDGQE